MGVLQKFGIVGWDFVGHPVLKGLLHHFVVLSLGWETGIFQKKKKFRVLVDFAMLWLAAYLLEAPWSVQYSKSALINF